MNERNFLVLVKKSGDKVQRPGNYCSSGEARRAA